MHQARRPGSATGRCPVRRSSAASLQWPARIRRLRPNAYFGPAGALPLGSVGCPTMITVHDLAIYRHPEWFPGRQPLSTRLVIPRSLDRADVIVVGFEHHSSGHRGPVRDSP